MAKGSENSGIVCLHINGSNATGFIVGDHQIATAGHCVINNDAWYSIEIQTYDKNGELTNTKLNPVEAHVPKVFAENDLKAKKAYSEGNKDDFETYTKISAPYDYALITVSDDLSGYVQFSLANSYNVSVTNFAGVPVYVTGCPQEFDNDTTENSEHLLYTHENRIYDTEDGSTSVLHYQNDTSSGQSGSPVYTIIKNIVGNDTYYTYTVLAIHKGYPPYDKSYNWGSLITKYHLQFYHNNPNASYIIG